MSGTCEGLRPTLCEARPLPCPPIGCTCGTLATRTLFSRLPHRELGFKYSIQSRSDPAQVGLRKNPETHFVMCLPDRWTAYGLGCWVENHPSRPAASLKGCPIGQRNVRPNPPSPFPSGDVNGLGDTGWLPRYPYSADSALSTASTRSGKLPSVATAPLSQGFSIGLRGCPACVRQIHMRGTPHVGSACRSATARTEVPTAYECPAPPDE